MAQFIKRCYPDLPEAAGLAALVGVKDDLEQVLSYCGELEKQIAAKYRGYHLWEALAYAAAVAYARCFGTGVRAPLPAALLEAAPAEVRETHGFIMDLRNKHIAHSVNVFEENRVVANVLVVDRAPRKVESVVYESIRFMPISDSEVARIRVAAEWYLAQTKSLIEAEQQKVLQLLRGRPLESILAFDREPPPPFLAEGAISKSRRRH
jgi:hypothetical protein